LGVLEAVVAYRSGGLLVKPRQQFGEALDLVQRNIASVEQRAEIVAAGELPHADESTQRLHHRH
jgi:hypothetical protein